MTTDEIAALYIKHADDFRLLLGAHKDGPVLAVFDRDTTLGYGAGGFCNQWLVSNIHAGAFCIPAVLAVAAMTEAWRAEIEKMPETAVYRAECKTEWTGTWRGGFVRSPYLPLVICAVVEQKAAEKRAEAGMEKMGFERVEAKVPYPPDVTSIDPRVMFPVKEIIDLANAVYELAAGVPALRSKVKDILHNLKIRKDTPS